MRTACLAAATVVALSAVASATLAAEPTGDWMVAEKTAVIRVAPCAPGQPALCGHIAWTKGPPGTDKNNPDPAKRSRSVIGLEVVVNMKPAGQNRWEGEIYNAEDGKTYSGNISLVSDNVLRIEGCVLGILCGGQNWTRAKCEEPAPPRPGSKSPPPSASVPLSSCREVAP